MSPRKLTEDDKKNMLELYRNSKATTSTLATEFGVSSSTVSRFLKNSLSQEEYEDLIQQKRLARTPRGDKKVEPTEPKQGRIDIQSEQQVILSPKSSIEKEPENVEAHKEEVSSSPVILDRESPSEKELEKKPLEIKKSASIKLKKKSVLEPKEELEDDEEDIVDVAALSAMLGEEIEDDEDDDDDDDEDIDVEDEEINYPHTSSYSDLEILPLSAASFPRTCYLVVDRAAELIVKPLQEFADLGTIPDEEVQQKTLPVFDNHRIAKRFSHRREKVIKVPDGKMLQKISPYLYEKGITRLLIRGQIYAISNN